MFAMLKYVPLVALFQDVSKEVNDAGKAKRPWYLQRSFFGALMALAAGFASIQFGVQISADDINIATDSLAQLVAVMATVYGAILSLYGIAMKWIKAYQSKQTGQAGGAMLGVIILIAFFVLAFLLSGCLPKRFL